MNPQAILDAYKSKKLSVQDVQRKLKEFEAVTLKHLLSEGQKGIWFLQKTNPEMSAYHIPICFRINQELNIGIFQDACRFLMEQHPVLTTVIEENNGIPYQVPRPGTFVFESEDISRLDMQAIFPYLRQKVKQPFSLEKGPFVRFNLFSRSQHEYIVLITIHHIIFDGSSAVPLMMTLLEAYQNLIQGKQPIVNHPQTTYGDFVAWEQQMLNGSEGAKCRSYWAQQLPGTLPVLELPTDHSRSVNPSFNGAVYTSHLSPELSKEVKSFTNSQNLTLSVIFLGIFKLLLYRYTEQDDIIVGLPTIGRPQARFEFLIGYFINMVPIRSQGLGTQPFSKFIKELQITLFDALEHAAYPFPTLIRDLNIPRMTGNSPVFQVAFFYQNYLQSTAVKEFHDRFQSSNSNQIEIIEQIHQEGEYEFVLEVSEQENTFVLNMKYNPDLYEHSTIARMMGHYQKLITEIIAQPNRDFRDYSFIPEEERALILDKWNATAGDYPDRCFHELFEAQAQERPDKISVCYEEESLTYQELDQKSTQLAIYLQKQGIKPDSMVGICVERSLEMIIGLMGILKAGGAYIPLDPNYPSERLEYMIQDSKVSLILTQSGLMAKMSQITGRNSRAIALDEDWDQIVKIAKTAESLKREVKPHHLAYVIYTSGSTGKPKGVMIPHQALTNFLISMSREPGIHSQDKLLAVTTYCFDIAGLELYLPLINGAQTVICSTEKLKDVEKLKQEIQRRKPTIMQATPVTWTMLFQTGWENKEKVKILCGGEALPEKLKQHFINTQSEAWNMFGPTETTIWSTVQRIVKDEPITIGKPIDNTQIYILDNNLKPNPIGIPGELCIAGDGLARGYLNRPELTAEKFIDHPFVPGKKLYKCGDLARWSANGTIEFLGRNDHQVKIRGFRIELGEIENQLLAHPGIRNCAVIVKDQEGAKQLIAYYVRKNQRVTGNFTHQQWREFLKLNLPDYMIPAVFIELESIPLTPNGKVNRKELMNRSFEPVKIQKPNDALPTSEIESKVHRIWKDLLPNSEINTSDGFFEIGGDSYIAVIAADRIKKTFDCDFNVTTIFKYGNIRNISQYISEIKGYHSVAKEEDSRNFHPSPPILPKMVDIPVPAPGSYPEYYQDSLAIIGISCHFPGAKDYLEFWQNLREGKESIKFLSPEELHRYHLPPEMIQNPNYVSVQASIEWKELFDPAFFNISPRDAECMDPQFKMLLLHSWKAIEDAGYTPKQIPETAVFMSTSNNFYQAFLLNSGSHSDQYVSWLLGQGGTIPTMISHKLGFRGPSFFVHSNCSSSLVGLYNAYQCLKANEANYALVGAATIFPTPNVGYIYEAGLNFSSDGHCKAFDASADGMIVGEGAAVIMLKKAADAIKDRDHIYALLRGISINNDGSDKAGFYAPSVKGQSEVIQKVLNATQVHPDTIRYIEAHGTGTKLGDPIELTALSEVYRKYTDKKQYCGIGSVKTNIGHLDAAAGLAGCIKVALSLHFQEIPPSINYKNPNPNIDFENSPFYVVDQRRDWQNHSIPLRAALSSFGIGGTNTHAIFEQSPMVNQPANQNLAKDNPSINYLIPLSAKNRERLHAYAQSLYNFLNPTEAARTAQYDESVVLGNMPRTLRLADIAFTLQIGREAMESRVVFIVNTIAELIQKLAQFIAGDENIEGCWQGEVKKSGVSIQLFENDEDTREIIHQWMMKGKIKKLAELWVKGYPLNWQSLNLSSNPCRISLPTYSFAGKSDRIFEQEIQFTDSATKIVDNGLNSAVIPVQAMPPVRLTGKGKGEDYTTFEKKVAEIWGRELGLTAINVYDNFLEMGGNSLIAVKLEIEMNKSGLPIDVSDIDQYPCVADMALFISQNTNNELHSKKILDNIEPFNVLYYRSCFYNDLFPVIKHFNKDIAPFLINDVAIYACSKNRGEKLLTVHYKSTKNFEELLHDQGINVSTQLSSDHIINDVILSISQNKPVIIEIDCYDVPMREDLYQKAHWAHSWLVYGYDDQKQLFRIIEHRHRDSLIYDKYEVSYRDLENAYQGYLQNFHQDSNQPTYYEFYLKNLDISLSESRDDEYRNIYHANMLNHKQDILEGLKEIKVFEETFKKIASNDQELRKKADPIIETLNSIINARKADLYKLKLFYSEEEAMIRLLDKVIKCWDAIRLKLARCIYTSVYDSKNIDVMLEKLSSIYEYELEYNSCQLSFLEKI